MTTIAVTGANGFVGRHVVRFLTDLGNVRVVAVGRNEERLKPLGVDYRVFDLSAPPADCYSLLDRPDVLIHLAWEGLPNYRELFHIERNLMRDYRFLKLLVEQGLPSLTVAGTCYEYGLQEGRLTEACPACPTTSYGIAKNALCRFLTALQEHHAFRLRWARLFFMHGEGQSPGSLMSLLDRAVADGAETFDMSGGEQLRDYLPVEEAAALVVKVARQNRYDGIFNVCSGTPVSIRSLVERRLEKLGSAVRLNLGVYPYPGHEPMAYWGDVSRLLSAVNAYEEEYGDGARG